MTGLARLDLVDLVSAEVSELESSPEGVDVAALVGSEVGGVVMGPVLEGVVVADSDPDVAEGVTVGVGVSEVVGSSVVEVGSSEDVGVDEGSVWVSLDDVGESLVVGGTLVSSLVVAAVESTAAVLLDESWRASTS